MTIKEAIIRTLQESKGLSTYLDVLAHIQKNQYCEFAGLTPKATVSAQLGDLVKSGDSRIKRVKKQEGGGYYYYHTENDTQVSMDLLAQEAGAGADGGKKTRAGKAAASTTYHERDLHILLSSYLKSSNIHGKTIYHEQSTAADGNQTWTHPDMVGIRFIRLNTKESQNLQKVVRRDDTFKISSYEIKREVNTDAELKKAYL